VVACLALVGLIVVPAAPAAAADCVDPGTAYPPVPWPQRMYDFERVWPLTRGAGVRVAVIDSGVDAGHPQLQGHVAAGTDFITPGGNGQGDCSGRGTQTAGIIVAQPQQNVGFHGVAPQATIVPIRVSDQSNGQSAGVAGIANGIRFAVNSGAKVILVSQASYFTDTNLANAVEGALAADVLVVAAVGEDGVKNGGNRTPYPAALPGVIGVAAIEESTLASENSGRGTFVDLVAPGVQVATTQRGGGLTLVEGSAYAAAFVAGTAALVRGWWPRMTVAEVVQRLIATASPAPGGRDSQTYGYGIVDPYSALADQLTDAEPAALPGMGQEDASDVARERSWTSSGNLAKLLAGIGVLVALALVGLGAAVPRGRRRRWRPSIARQPVQRPEDDEPTPPVQLFADRETAPGA
jgi:type VII secretion-associated serine protease mycosin